MKSYKTIDKNGVVRTYNSEGREIEYKNSHGYWRKIKYDSEGREIEYKDSDGYWKKIKYSLKK
jgi:YD repeat-containing protein